MKHKPKVNGNGFRLSNQSKVIKKQKKWKMTKNGKKLYGPDHLGELFAADLPYKWNGKKQQVAPAVTNRNQANGFNKQLETKKTVQKKGIQQQRKELPIFSGKKRLMKEVKRNETSILIGETGSGKTTQLPQYLLEGGLDRGGVVAVTQPRRVAAITIAKRVAEEMGTTLGELVGYCVRFEDVTSEKTKVKYVTDGMLLREAMLDPLLEGYTVVILDEAHERTVHTDILFGVVQKAQESRRTSLSPLKLIVMSATMDMDHFSAYFNSAPVLYLEGRQYPVHIFQAQALEDDYVFSTIVTVFQVHRQTPADHHILVFLTGQEEIEMAARYIRQVAKELEGSSHPPLVVLPLYASLAPIQQMKVFQDAPPGHRKIILSTNIAETSVTIKGIKVVIDSGMVKARTYHSKTGLEILKVQHVSQAQAWQRSGRVGRESAGTCYRVYTKATFDGMLKDTVPEIKRCNLSSVVLQLLSIGIKDVTGFKFMDAPPGDAILAALRELQNLGAVTTDGPLPELTKIGLKMAKFPLEPRFSKAILASKEFGCSDEIITIIALLSSDSTLLTPTDKREKAEQVRNKFASSEGDHLTLLNIWKAYNHVKERDRETWCYEHFVHSRRMKHVVDVRAQLVEICRRAKIKPSSCGERTEELRKCLLIGLHANVAELQRDGRYFTLCGRESVDIHPSSVLFRSKPSFVIFTDLIHTGKNYIKGLSIVDPDWFSQLNLSVKRKHKKSNHTAKKQHVITSTV